MPLFQLYLPEPLVVVRGDVAYLEYKPAEGDSGRSLGKLRYP